MSDTVTEADLFNISMFYGNLKFFVENPPAGVGRDTLSGLDAALCLLELDVCKLEATS